ncbi:MAG: hypothetical protein HOQ13_15540 [Dermatophilaceae bacterium]|nr:hypothetical protein [Dermatophilaceae bacterium]
MDDHPGAGPGPDTIGRWTHCFEPGRQDWETSAVAALLHAGRGSALCDTSAGYLWGLIRSAPHPIRVVVPAARRVRDVEGVLISRSRHAPDRVDPLAWPHRTKAGRRDREYEWRVVAEIDGRLGHGGWLDVQRDRRRDRAATVAGRTTLRCYWTDLVPTACELALEVAQVLRAKGWEGRPRGCHSACPVGAAAASWNIGPR